MKDGNDVFFVNYAMSWGQVWMKNQWKAFKEWYNNNNESFNLPYLPSNINRWSAKSWLKYHVRYCLETNKYFVYPYESLSTNNSEAGTHIKETKTILQTELLNYPIRDYRLPNLCDSLIKYDSFFEPKFLASYLNIPDNDFAVDFFGRKNKILKSRYILSLQSMPYKVLKSYALVISLLKLNIFLNNEGYGIFLYDTNSLATPQKSLSKKSIP